ncbi:ATP/GTP-binding protein [Actinomadura sp. KC216]|uniref:GTP-binding protein n=1 Tax=Actinomadura sp. KC216 TaxID=2530370 RepID=UPI0010488050|nr:ATP/GTP-binding protein [Actinomadura sp. KC216]TDB76601.1 ATP/GTP-binding protein [Actinomadura sp. KC216]
MAYNEPEPPGNGPEAPYSEPAAASTQVKILIAGGFGVGKTTFVGSVSEIEPLSTEELITAASVGVDDLGGVAEKSTTTVALDFGRITFDQHGIVLYLFGTPGQRRFWFLWNELSAGALGAVVLADTRRLEDCFEAVDFFENRGTHFLVAVNEFDAAFRYDTGEVRAALGLDPRVPIVLCDARDRSSAIAVLRALVRHLLTAASATSATPSASNSVNSV